MYTLMFATIALLLVALVLVMLGYRFNRTSNTLEQGGLVQFISRPTGADITIGAAHLANQTPTKITVNPGLYTTKMEKDGYQTWRKNVQVIAGQVLWLNYAHLVPTTIKQTVMQDVGDVDEALVSPDAKQIAIVDVGTAKRLRLISADNDTASVKTVNLDEAILTTARSVDIVQWSRDGSKLLLKVTNTKTTDWVVVDVDAPSDSVNITEQYDVEVKNAVFNPRNNDQVFIMTTDGDLRTIRLDSDALSPVMQTNVKQFTLYGNDAILYLYTQKTSRSIGYITIGETVARDLPIVADDVTLIAGTEYFRDAYISVATRKNVRIYQLDTLPNSTSTSTISMSQLGGFNTKKPTRWLSTQGGGRFVVAQTTTAYTTYDLELVKLSTTQFGVTQSVETQWVDGYHVTYPVKRAMRVAEFDGANTYDIQNASSLALLRTPDGRYIYTLNKTTTGYDLVRSMMQLN